MMKLFVGLFSLCFLFTNAAMAAPNSMVIEGNLYDSSDTPVEDSSVVFTLEILSPGAEECLLFQEQHTVNMTNSGGYFNVTLGAGTQTGSDYEDTNNLMSSLNNSAGVITPTTCAAVGSYTPAIADGRKLRLTYNINGGGAQTLAQDIDIRSTAFAMSAGSVGGLQAADILPLVGGTMTGNIDLGANNITTTRAPIAGSDLTNRTYVDAQIAGVSAIAPTGGSMSGALDITGSADAVQLEILANATQSTNPNFVEFKNSAGTVLASIRADGNITAATDLTDKNFVDTAVATSLPLAGGTMTGGINLDSNTITNAGNISGTGSLSMNGISSGTNIALWNTGNFMGFQAPAGAADLIWTLPGTDGAANEVLQTDGSGTLQWADLPSAAVDSVYGRTGAVVATTSDYDAVQIDNTAAGTIIATNVQAAINELDTEKAATTRDMIAGSGLTGGGDLSADRTFNVVGGDGIVANANDIAIDIAGTADESTADDADTILIRDDSDAGNLKEMSRLNFLSGVQDNMGDHTATMNIDTNNNSIVDLEGGSSTAPGLSFFGDGDTGLFSSTTDTLSFTTGSTEALTINSSQFVGIGTSAPYSLLHIQAPNGSNSEIFRAELSGQPPAIHVEKFLTPTRPSVGIGTSATDQATLLVRGHGSLVDTLDVMDSSGSSSLIVKSTGEVGINNANPTHKFVVSEDTSTGQADSFLIENSASGIEGLEVNFIDGDPKVGIGTAAPTGEITMVIKGDPDATAEPIFEVRKGDNTPLFRVQENDSVTVNGNLNVIGSIEGVLTSPPQAEGAGNFDFASTAMGYTTGTCNAATYNLHSLKAGGIYYYHVQGTAAGTCTLNLYFSADSSVPVATIRYPAGGVGPQGTIGGQTTLFTIRVFNTEALVTQQSF